MSIKTRLNASLAVVGALALAFVAYVISLTGSTVTALEELEREEIEAPAGAVALEEHGVLREVAIGRAVLASVEENLVDQSKLGQQATRPLGYWIGLYQAEETALVRTLDRLSEITALELTHASSSGTIAHAEDVQLLQQLHEELLPVETQILDLLLAGNPASANRILDVTYQGMAEDYRNAIATLVEDERRTADEAIETRVSEAQLARTISISVVPLVAVIVLATGWFVAGGVVGRIEQLSRIADRLSEGDVDGLIIDVGGSDEVSNLGESHKGVSAAIQLLQGELKMYDASILS